MICKLNHFELITQMKGLMTHYNIHTLLVSLLLMVCIAIYIYLKVFVYAPCFKLFSCRFLTYEGDVREKVRVCVRLSKKHAGRNEFIHNRFQLKYDMLCTHTAMLFLSRKLLPVVADRWRSILRLKVADKDGGRYNGKCLENKARSNKTLGGF